jgi:hypothetical protein
MTPEELKRRTKALALRVIRVFKALPRNEEARTLGKQNASLRNVGDCELPRRLSITIESRIYLAAGGRCGRDR